MKDLQAKIEAMLEGEKKRRETALKWVGQVEKILLPICSNLYCREAVWLGDYSYISLEDGYIRFMKEDISIPYGGSYPEDSYGIMFWRGVKEIVEFIPKVTDKMDGVDKEREELLSKLNIE